MSSSTDQTENNTELEEKEQTEEKEDDIFKDILDKNNPSLTDTINVSNKNIIVESLYDDLQNVHNVIVKDINDSYNHAILQNRNLHYTCPQEKNNKYFKSLCIGMTLRIPENTPNVTNLMYKNYKKLSELYLMLGDEVTIELNNGKSYTGIFCIRPSFNKHFRVQTHKQSPGYACILGKDKSNNDGPTYIIYFHDDYNKNKLNAFTSGHLSNVRKDIVSVNINKRGNETSKDGNENVYTYLQNNIFNADFYNIDGNKPISEDEKNRIVEYVKSNFDNMLPYINSIRKLNNNQKEKLFEIYDETTMTVKPNVNIDNILENIYHNSETLINTNFSDNTEPETKKPKEDIEQEKSDEDEEFQTFLVGGKKYTKKNKSKKINKRKQSKQSKQIKQIKQLKKVLKQSKKQYKKQIKQSKKH